VQRSERAVAGLQAVLEVEQLRSRDPLLLRAAVLELGQPAAKLGLVEHRVAHLDVAFVLELRSVSRRAVEPGWPETKVSSPSFGPAADHSK